MEQPRGRQPVAGCGVVLACALGLVHREPTAATPRGRAARLWAKTPFKLARFAADRFMTPVPLIVGLGGTNRPGSTSERALQTALAHAASLGCDTLAFTGSLLPAEIYDPSLTQRSGEALALVDALRRADGLIVAHRHTMAACRVW